MKKEELISIIRERNPLLADAVSHMVDYVTDKYPAAYPNKEQTEAVNRYLHSVMADGDGTMSRENCEHRRSLHSESPSMPYDCLTGNNKIVCKMCLTTYPMTAIIISRKEVGKWEGSKYG